jgi:hypothetical protein
MDKATLIESVTAARVRTLNCVADLSERQAAFKPDEDSWSITEIIEHLVLAEASGVTKIWAAAEGAKTGRAVWPGENTNAGLSIDEVITRTSREREAAPPIATPHIGGPLAYWMESFRMSQSILDALSSSLEGIELTSIVYPHFLCGPLDGEQRIDFLRFHMDRHCRQIERARNHPDFPKA